MIDNYCTGINGFIGKQLYPLLKGETVAIWHDAISTYQFHAFRRFFFLSTYGNMIDHTESDKILRANVLDLGRTLFYATQFRDTCESFMFVSSSSVTLPVQTPYSRTKQAAEQMVLSMPIPGCVVRLYSCTGAGEQREHLIPTLIRSCLEGEQMDLVLGATHDYIDVSDVAKGLLSLAKKSVTGVFEFGSGIATTNEEVLNLVESATGKKANVKIVDSSRSYDNRDWRCKDFRASEYGWKVRKSLKDSIGEMVKAYAS